MHEPIQRSLERRGLVAARLHDEHVRLLNAGPHLQATFDAARARGEFRTAELSADLNISVPACNNRLKQLLDAGLLVRELGVPAAGGLEFRYLIPWQIPAPPALAAR